MVSRAVGVSVPVTHLPKRREVQHVSPDHQKFVLEFGVNHTLPLYDGLERMADWAKTQELHEPKPFAGIEITKNLPEQWRKLADEH
jgi:nucleoside-diphosphate-sugar epimerase